MPAGHASTKNKNSKVAASQPSPKRTREHRSDDGATILPNAENFVSLVRKVTRPGLVVQLLERVSATALPELKALADAAKGKLPVESRQSFFHAVANHFFSATEKTDCAFTKRLTGPFGAATITALTNHAIGSQPCPSDNSSARRARRKRFR